jgi:hypothetical protein
MYKKIIPPTTTLKVNNSFQGETIETKCARIMSNKEPIKDSAPITYTERKDGVIPGMNIRTDRWEHAVESMEKATKAHRTRREDAIGKRAKEGMEKEKKGESTNKEVGGAENSQATGNQSE